MNFKYERKELGQDKINWIQNEAKQGEILEGTVKNIKPFGAFVEVYAGVEALLPQDEVLKYQNEHNTILKVGDKIETKVTKFNPTDKRISLSVKVKTPAIA